METILTEKIKLTLKDAGKKLTGGKKRAFMAQVRKDYFNSSPRNAETHMGWSRKAVQRGLEEMKREKIIVNEVETRGRKKTEEKLPNIVKDIEDLIEGESQADRKFQSKFAYVKLSGRTLMEKLIEKKGYRQEELPSRQNLGDVLNRMGYSLKKHKKRNH
jgi:hypothetical protein